MDNFKERILGRTGIKVGRLGVAASYGAPAQSFERAFEQGCNYFYYGSGRKRASMREAIRNLVSKGKRDELVVSLNVYARYGLITEMMFARTLKTMKLEHADIMIMGWHNRPPSQMLVDLGLKLKQKGLVRFLGMSGHNRKLFPKMAGNEAFDLFHVRYNAAHRGAEEETFSGLDGENRPGVVTYTATRWGRLLNPKKTPSDLKTPTASECYRFVMTNPAVDVCMCGPANMNQMQEALTSLELGPLQSEDMERMKKVGDHVRAGALRSF